MPAPPHLTRRRFHPWLGRGLLGLVLAGAGAGCASLPSNTHRTPSVAFPDTARTRLGTKIAERTALHPGRSGIYPLPDSVDAFTARIAIAAAADRSLDVQYYIWHPDTTGFLLFEALWQAAERGVRVRLLLDDMNTKGLDPTLAALDSHPNIEVRLFNPFSHRSSRALDYLTDFSRVNRRMHNKSMTADGQVTIVGGRNIGDEYFAAGKGVAFTDLDVTAVGSVAQEVSAEFDLYWASESAYPADRLVAKADAAAVATLLKKFRATRASPEAQEYLEAIKASPFLGQLRTGDFPLDWCPARVHYDDPAKILHPPDVAQYRMGPHLREAMGQPARTMEIISPYFVPGEEGTAALCASARSGVKVRILTNSLAATDVSAVHAGYARYRETLVAAGITVYELKPTAEQIAARRHPASEPGKPVVHHSSSASLHAKTFALDGERIFVGSFNLDPRSVALNTEMGILLESRPLAQDLQHTFDEKIPQRAYEVRLTAPGGRLEWIEHRPDGDRRYRHEPETGWFRRFGVGFLSILPIEWLL